MKTKSDDSLASFLLDLDFSGMNMDDEEDAPMVQAVAVPVVPPSAPYEDEVLRSQREQASAYRPPPTAPLQAPPASSATTTAISPQPPPPPPSRWLPQDEREAHAAAAAAREKGVAMIRDHLSSYLEQNPGASYVTWIATLHPENAEVTIDPRFHIPGNPWATVYEDTKAGMMLQDPSESDHPKNDDEEDPEITTVRHACAVGGLIPLIIGFSLVASAMSCALSLQLTSTTFYLMAVVCQAAVRGLSSYNVCAQLLVRFPCRWLVQVFWFTDSLVLVLDTLVVELLAGIAFFLCFMFSFSAKVGMFYHQWIRRSAHMVRWAFRKPLEGCRPHRTLACGPRTHHHHGEEENLGDRHHHEYLLASSADDDDDSARIP